MKPCMGLVRCPHCGKDNPVVWVGNHWHQCLFCHKVFEAKRQKMKKVEHFEKRRLSHQTVDTLIDLADNAKRSK